MLIPAVLIQRALGTEGSELQDGAQVIGISDVIDMGKDDLVPLTPMQVSQLVLLVLEDIPRNQSFSEAMKDVFCPLRDLLTCISKQ